VFSSREGSGYESSSTIWSEDRLSNKEVEKIRKWVGEKERREERECYIERDKNAGKYRKGKG